MANRGRPKTLPDGMVDIHVYLEPELWAAVRHAAEAADRPVTAEVRRALRRLYLREKAA